MRRILLGSQLRQLREDKAITRQDAGYAIRASESKISRMELGRVSFKIRDVEDLLTLYGVTEGPERESLLDMARNANSTGWWHNFGDALPKWFQTYIGLEEAASLIRSYEAQFVPGLLQTRDYAGVLAAYEASSDEEAQSRVDLKIKRQKLLKSSSAPRFWTIIDEAALRRPIGGHKVMREQISHLLEVMDLPNVTVQMIPFGAGLHGASAGSFSVLRFPETELPDVVYLEFLSGALYLDKREEVDRHAAVLERLSVESLPPKTTASQLMAMRDEV